MNDNLLIIEELSQDNSAEWLYDSLYKSLMTMIMVKILPEGADYVISDLKCKYCENPDEVMDNVELLDYVCSDDHKDLLVDLVAHIEFQLKQRYGSIYTNLL